MSLERLQKVLARAGLGSRRACEDLITDGRVTVDGETVTELGSKADAAVQDIRVDGSRVRPEAREYWLLNKPKGVVCTNYDPAGRRRPIDLVPKARGRLFPVGRLDADSKGLLILTNDGDFANHLTHPRYEVPKTYRATVSGRVTEADLGKLTRGIHLAEGKARAARFRVLKKGVRRSILEITLREGKNRQIRRMLARLRHPVRDLVRTRIGKISLRGLGPGKARPLEPREVQYLKALAAGDAEEAAPHAKRGRGGPNRKRPPRGNGPRAKRTGPKKRSSRPS